MDDNVLYTHAEAALSGALDSRSSRPGGAEGDKRVVPAEFPVFGERQMRNFEASLRPMRIFDRETLKYLAVNDAALKLYGYTRDEFLALNLLDTRHPDEHASVLAMLASQTDYIAHWGGRRHVTKSGDVLEVETITQDILFDGRRARLSLTVDVTGRLRMQELLWRRQQEFETLAENLPDLVARYDRNRRFLYANSAIERTFGVERGHIIGRTQREAGFAEGLAVLYDDSLAGVFTTGQPHKVEFRMDCPGGERLFEAQHVAEYDAAGSIGSVLCVARDITSHKRAERSLLETQQHLQVAIRGGSVGLYDWNVKTGAVYFSPEWKKQLGYEDHELHNDFRAWESRIHPDDRVRISAATQAYLANPAIDYQQEYRLRHKDGSYRWMLSRASAHLGAGGSVERMFGCHVDITDQKRAEAERLENAVRQRDALVREVHHRIKNSLQGVVGLLGQKIRKNPAIASEIEETIGQLQSVALVYGLQETRPDGLLSLTRVMDAIISSAEGLIGGRVDRVIEHRSQRPACLASGEAVSVAFALNELVFNALKHQRAAAGRKRARVSVRATTDAVEIRIINRGRLPDGFDFARGRAIGNGLGLVRTLLAAPGGDITFSSGRNRVEVVLKLGPPLLTVQSRRA